MITLTITLKSTAHQIVLSYKTMAAADSASREPDESGVVRVADDFGRSVSYAYADVASVEYVDLDAAVEGMLLKAEWRAAAENKLQGHFGSRPDLRPHIGNQLTEMFRNT